MTWYEIVDKIVCDFIITPIFILAITITGTLWIPIIILLYLLSSLTLIIHKLEKRHVRKLEEEFDAELDEAIMEIQLMAETKQNDL